MNVGVVFPQTEIGNDPGAIRAYAQAVEAMGYTHLLVFDHVLGANPERPGGFKGPYTFRHPFHEPFVLFGFLAAATTRLGLVTGIVILPQRQTALVAKQAATADVLSGGRLRLGVAVGWNPVEFEALGEDFKTRGRRIEEQIAVMRALWTEELVDFDGKYHQVRRAGVNPLPVQRPIPVWMGGVVEPVIKRAARIADGWFPQFQPGPQSAETIERLRGYLRDAGRRPEDFGIEGRISMFNTPEDQWGTALQGWRDMGATHVSFNTMNARLGSPQAHIDAIRRFSELVVSS
jgi:probable F420-dependent oxidoreductase